MSSDKVLIIVGDATETVDGWVVSGRLAYLSCRGGSVGWNVGRCLRASECCDQKCVA